MKKIDIKEFCDEGYLQEVNRLFLHPLGMALSVIEDDDGNCTLGGIWDCRDDPEGMIFEHIYRKKKKNVNDKMKEKKAFRRESLGFEIQRK